MGWPHILARVVSTGRLLRQLLEAHPAPVCEESVLFDAEYRRRLLAWAAERVRDEFSAAAWQAFWKSSVEGRGAEQVADDLGLTIGTVYQYKSRVVARLRREIERVEGEPDELL